MDPERYRDLHDFVATEVAGMVATASGQGFSRHETLSSLVTAAWRAIEALDAADGSAFVEPASLPAGPHSAPALVDKQKTPGTGALPDADAIEIDPGVG
jgi:hypothetical protein